MDKKSIEWLLKPSWIHAGTLCWLLFNRFMKQMQCNATPSLNEYPKKSLLKSGHPKNYFPNTQKIPESKISNPKNPSIIPVTWNPEYPPGGILQAVYGRCKEGTTRAGSNRKLTSPCPHPPPHLPHHFSHINNVLVKAATSRFVHLEQFSLNILSLSLQSVLIFCIINHPCSLLVYSFLFGVCLPWQTII